MTFITANTHTNEPRASQARGALELANACALLALSRAQAAGGAARATTATAIKTVNTITALINGAFITGIVAADPMWTLGVAGSNTVVAAGSFQKYALLLDAAGTATVQEGVQSTANAASVAWTNVSAVSRYAPLFTILGQTKFSGATLTIATDATHTFTPGTTALNAAGITATLADGLDQSLLPLLANPAGLVIGNGG